ncbi:hypothetical protein K438DRAFT_20579 [Mycena galopus ATCC 62051]|nr:hypothetical protein K438DRAFT_20579 [Mycena galopus ATCC 62051]
MVKVAQNSIPEPLKSRVEFRQAIAEDLSFIEDGTVDLITAAQSAHWFDWTRAWPELGRILKPGGTFAFWVGIRVLFIHIITVSTEFPGILGIPAQSASRADAAHHRVRARHGP